MEDVILPDDLSEKQKQMLKGLSSVNYNDSKEDTTDFYAECFAEWVPFENNFFFI